MEYGLWNFHGGFWTGGNNNFNPSEGISRNFYTTVNNEIEPPAFHITTPANGDVVNVFTTNSVIQPCQTNLRTNLEFLTMKTVPINSRVPPMVMPGHQNDHLQNVGIEVVPMASDLVTEQSSMDSLAPTDSSMPPLLSHQPNPPSNNSSNHNNNNNITNNNNINNNNNDEEDEPPPLGKKDKTKLGRRDDGEVWEDVNGTGTNIKIENNSGIDYLFQPSYQQSVYGVISRVISNNKREPATSDETDEDDEEVEDGISQSRIVDNIQSDNSMQNRFRSSDGNEMEAQVARHITGGYKLNGKRRAGPLTPQRVRYEREEYRCQICAYSCTVEKAFYKHLKVHSLGRQVNQVKISCVICGKDRSSEVDMNKHMKKHRDDRYFCCDICIFKTVQLKKLIQHRRMHTGEKPHLCPHCSYRSARRDNLRSHVRRVHKKDNLFCDTFSPRGLVLTPNISNSTPVPITPMPSSNQSQHSSMSD